MASLIARAGILAIALLVVRTRTSSIDSVYDKLGELALGGARWELLPRNEDVLS